MYKRRNEIERLFRRLKGFRRIFSCFDKLDVIFLGFILFSLISEALRQCYQTLDDSPKHALHIVPGVPRDLV